MAIQIVEATIHQIIKKEQTQGPESVTVKPRGTVLANDDVLKNLCADLVGMYGTVLNNNGTLGIDPSVHQWPPLAQSYLDGGLDFISFSTQSVNLIAKKMHDVFLATGGYALFLRYKVDVQDFLLVAMLKLKAGAAIDAETLDLKETLNIDLSHLNEAARVNLTRWIANQQPYLTFIKGRTKSGSVSDYFRDALACTNFTDAKHQTEQVIKAAQDFVDAQAWATPEARQHAYRTVRTKLFTCLDENKREVPLATVAAAIHPQAPEDFLAFVRGRSDDGAYHLNDRFTPSRKVYIGLKRVTGKMGTVSVTFEVADLEAERVRYDEGTDSLILQAPSAELKQAIQEYVSGSRSSA